MPTLKRPTTQCEECGRDFDDIWVLRFKVSNRSIDLCNECLSSLRETIDRLVVLTTTGENIG